MERRYSSAINPFRSFDRTIKYLKYHPVKTVFVVFIALLNVGITLLGTSLLKPVIDDYVTPAIEGTISLDVLMKSLGILSIILLCLYTLSFVLGFLQMRIMIDLSQSSIEHIRNALFAKLQKLPLSYFDSNTHGEIMSRFTNDLDIVSEMFSTSFLEILTSSVLLVGIVSMLFVTNWLLAIVALILFPLIIYIVRLCTHFARHNFDEVQKALGNMNGFIEESLAGQKIIKVFNREKRVEEEFDKLNKTWREASFKSTFYSSTTVPIVNNFSNLIFILCTLVGSVFAFVAKISWLPLTVGTLSAFISFVRQLNRPLNRSANQLNIVQAALAGAERVYSIMDLPDEPAINVSKWHSYKSEEDGKYYWTDGIQTKPVLGEVIFDHVDFSYIPGQTVLKGVSLYAKPGQKIALVGSTGAGKTTIANLLTRFYDIDSGQILIDGIDIKDINRTSMRRSMSLVLQDTHLFTGTIMDNIRYGRLKATDEDCIRAAKIVHADEYIIKLKNGYNTIISSNNDSLSQGQRQLLSIARAAVNNPPILILDEATSSIDTRTEHLIENGMDELMKGKTVLVIAHRLSTVRYSNAILVLEHGEIIERGTHESLLKKQGRYYALCTGEYELK